MGTPFDLMSVLGFVGMLLIWFCVVQHKEPRRFLHFILAGITLAVANQAGNAGLTLLAVILFAAACGYVAIVSRT